MKICKLEKSHEVTKKMFEKSNIEDECKDAFIEVADGNPGAANYLIEIYKRKKKFDNFRFFLTTAKLTHLTGENFYMYIKKAKDIEQVMESFRMAGFL